MKPIRLMTYRSGSNLPPLPGNSFQHSSQLFHIYEQTPGYAPILIVASIDSQPVAKLLSVIRSNAHRLPSYLFKRCEVFGSGEYLVPDLPQDELFRLMLEHLTNEAQKECFLIEFRNLPIALFGYKHFKRNGYFPINWLRIYNSLHSLSPEKRLSSSVRRQITRAQKNGAIIKQAETDSEIEAFLQMLRRHYSSKVRKHFPDLQLFRLLISNPTERNLAKIFLVKHHEKIIGGSFCIYSDDHVYLCFSGGLRKSYARLHPGTMAVWAAITHAYEQGYQHFEFVDAGLPFKKIGYRNFILGFGGKQVSTRCWFRFQWNWLNKLSSWFYR